MNEKLPNYVRIGRTLFKNVLEDAAPKYEKQQLDVMLIGSQLIEAIEERIKGKVDSTELYFRIDDLFEEWMDVCEDADTLRSPEVPMHDGTIIYND